MNALFGGVENLDKFKPVLDAVMRGQPLLTEKRDPKDLTLTDQMQADVDGFTQQSKRPRAIAPSTTAATNVLAGAAATSLPSADAQQVAAEAGEAASTAPASQMMPPPMWMFPPMMQGSQGPQENMQMPPPGDFPMGFIPPPHPFYPPPPFYGWMPPSQQAHAVPTVGASPDPELYTGGLNHVFLQLKQLLDMHDQERMNWFTHSDQIARAIALLQHQFDEYDLKKEDASVATLLQTATSKPLAVTSKERLLLDEQRLQLDKEMSYLRELMVMPGEAVKKSSSPAAAVSVPQKSTIQYVIQL